MSIAARPHRNCHLKNRPPWERHSPEWRKRNLARACRTVAATGLLAAGLLMSNAPAQLPHPFDVSKIDGLNGYRLINRQASSISGVGDIDADGYDDILLSDHLFGGQCWWYYCDYRGIVYWVRGRPDHHTPQIDLSELALPDGVITTGPTSRSRTGHTVTGIGDFNGDMINDLLFTSLIEGAGNEYNGVVVFGRPDGFPDGINIDLADGTNGFLISGTDIISASAAGDVNGDGFDDIIVGNSVAYNKYGAAWVIFGRDQSEIETSIDVRNLDGSDGYIIRGVEKNNGFAYNTYAAISEAGDFDGDGIDDIHISEWIADPGNVTNAGSSYILFGSIDRIHSNVQINMLDGTIGFRINGTNSGDGFGSIIAPLGDMNGDGFSDILAGASGYDLDGNSSFGANIVLFGNRDLDRPTITVSDIGVSVHGFRINGISTPRLGRHLSGISDFNGDGKSDLATSVILDTGIAFLIYGNSAIQHPFELDLVDGENGINIYSTKPTNLVGENIHLIGDHNGDGLSDMIFGIPNYSEHTRYYCTIFGSGTSQQATYKSFARSDDAPISGIGYANKGAQSAPSSRLWVDFELGSGPGKDGASLQTVTITRRGSDLSNINNPANVYWYLETDREDYIIEGRGGVTAGQVDIMVKYIDGDIWHLDENSLALYQAPSPSGPWTLMENQVLNTGQNRIKARVNGLLPQYFAISGTPTQTASVPTPSLLTLTPFTDFWLSPLGPGARFFQPANIGFTGFQQSILGWKSFSGDFNGDGLNDVSTITPWGEWWTAFATPTLGFEPPERQGINWISDPENGWLVSSGDFNGDETQTLIQLTPDGSIFQSVLPTIGTPPVPSFFASTNLHHDPQNGLHVFVADLNGDEIDDLININNVTGAHNVELSNGTGFNVIQYWGAFDFKHDPDTKWGVHFGDFNGDGRDDICQITQFGDAWVALSTGTKFNAPTRWGWLGFQDDPNRGDGWYVFVADIDRDGRDDLVQLTDTGEVWAARSNGADGFLTPTRNAQLGFHHKPDGPWQVFVVK